MRKARREAREAGTLEPLDAVVVEPAPIEHVPSRPVVVRALEDVAPWTAKPIPRSRSCCWPIGEPRTPGFRFCDAPSVAGRSYCEQHMRKAYQPRRTLAEKTAAQEASDKAYAARMASMSHRTVRTQWKASEV